MAGLTATDRTALERLTEESCWRFLAQHALGRIALVHLGAPMIFPVNYALDGQKVIFRAAPGTKLALAGAGVRVAFEVDEASEAFETGTSVVVHGTLRTVKDRAEIERLRRLPLRTWLPDRDHFVAVETTRITGRSITPHLRMDGVVADGG